MASSKLSASADFFKDLYLIHNELVITHGLIEELTADAAFRCLELGDRHLEVNFEQLGIVLTRNKQTIWRLENRLKMPKW